MPHVFTSIMRHNWFSLFHQWTINVSFWHLTVNFRNLDACECSWSGSSASGFLWGFSNIGLFLGILLPFSLLQSWLLFVFAGGLFWNLLVREGSMGLALTLSLTGTLIAYSLKSSLLRRSLMYFQSFLSLSLRQPYGISLSLCILIQCFSSLLSCASV